jgi:hypothetical protein
MDWCKKFIIQNIIQAFSQIIKYIDLINPMIWLT